jgi:hypothetical protein
LYWYNLDVVQKVNFVALCLVVLDISAVVDISFQKLDIVLNVFGLMGNGEVEAVVAQSETQPIQTVTQPHLVLQVSVDLPQQIVLRIGVEGKRSRSLHL